ncbi:cysteine hydrolase family protein [Intrasporangium calvum]|uniref:Isochorismatase hydrolase n=1 Tax=Intrasporangium calvum (strain ATCC 23552 / DSM 43043 / JCM 3097 / NBRC 12989 / NCIMB 10167 / NRRL B-3866 / 7 KIP) TaxID=710696 RepID=E6SCP1_INTC7|nr:isochorismatase family cysteine hydrolase [Intrasporangium calvum]ADU49645.1 isochorismatase hydrolase [Intrasporangium calvum DSM 43043]
MPPTTVLLMLDYQVALAQEGDLCLAPPLAAQVRERNVLTTAKRVLEAARASDVPVFHVRLAFDPTYRLRTNRLKRFDAYPDNGKMLAGSGEAEFVADLAPVDGEPVVDKGCVNAFIGTPLRDVLAAEGITHVILGGIATHLVVESTARHASDCGLQVSIVEDMCAAPDPTVHEFAMTKTLPLFGTVTTADEVIGSWA